MIKREQLRILQERMVEPRGFIQAGGFSLEEFLSIPVRNFVDAMK